MSSFNPGDYGPAGRSRGRSTTPRGIGGTQSIPTAISVTYDPAASGLTATDVQAALDELDAAIDSLPDTINGAITAGWDAGEDELDTGTMKDVDVIAPADGEIVAAYVVGDNGSAVVDVWVDDAGSYPPTDGDSVTASAPPTLSAASLSVDSTLSGWTVAFSAGDVFRFHPDSVSGLTNLTVTLIYERT